MAESITFVRCGSATPGVCRCNCDGARDPKTFDHVCEHVWDGWRDFENGGEAVCSRCGMGCMHHDLMAGI